MLNPTESHVDALMRMLEDLRILRRLLVGARVRPPQSGRSVTGLEQVRFRASSTAHLRQTLATHVESVDLTPSEFLAVSNFYGLYSYPCDLAAGHSPLVGSIPTAHGRVAGRSTVATLVKSGTEKIEEALPAPPHDSEPLIFRPEVDPVADRGWLEPDHLGFELSPTERIYVVEASMLAALDLIDRSSSSRDLSAALRNWVASHGVEPGPPDPLVKPRYEHRRSAFACATIALHGILSDPELLRRCASGDVAAGWLGLPVPPDIRGRVADETKYGPMQSGELEWDDLVLLAGEVFEGRDDQGRAAAVLMDELRSGRYAQELSEDDARTVIFAFGRGLAAKGSWQSVELARWMEAELPNTLTTTNLIAFASHVASLHLQDDLAWRFAAAAERQVDRLARSGDATPRQKAIVELQVSLIRSGCCLRESDRWCEAEEYGRAADRLTEGLSHLERARNSHQLTQDENSSGLSGFEIRLRALELLFMAMRLRNRGHPVDGFTDEADQLQTALAEARSFFEANRRDDDADDDVLEARLNLLEAATDNELREISRELDDSPRES